MPPTTAAIDVSSGAIAPKLNALARGFFPLSGSRQHRNAFHWLSLFSERRSKTLAFCAIDVRCEMSSDVAAMATTRGDAHVFNRP